MNLKMHRLASSNICVHAYEVAKESAIRDRTRERKNLKISKQPSWES
jgi:hypothetical protein